MIVNEERRALQETARLLAWERFGLLAADLPESPGKFCFGEVTTGVIAKQVAWGDFIQPGCINSTCPLQWVWRLAREHQRGQSNLSASTLEARRTSIFERISGAIRAPPETMS